MTYSSPQQYLESKVLTASQPQLHLMLLDGACRFVSRAQAIWAEGSDFVEVDVLLGKGMDILEELVQGTASGAQQLSKDLEEQYVFLYRELALCRVNQDLPKLQKCLELLNYQRTTWKMACERVESEHATPAAPKTKSVVVPHVQVDTTLPAAGFSLEA